MEYFAPLRVMCTTKNEGKIKKSYYTSCKRQKSSDCLLAGSIRIMHGHPDYQLTNTFHIKLHFSGGTPSA